MQCLLQKLLQHHRDFQQGTHLSNTTISVRDKIQQMEVEDLCRVHEIDLKVLDFVVDELTNVGPVAGLLAAHRVDPTAHWLVTGCDYPLLETATLEQLRLSHDPGTFISCFQNEEEFYEPLLAIWSSKALQRLDDIAKSAKHSNRKLGPSSAIRAFRTEETVVCLKPLKKSWIRNVNTPADWMEVKAILERPCS